MAVLKVEQATSLLCYYYILFHLLYVTINNHRSPYRIFMQHIEFMIGIAEYLWDWISVDMLKVELKVGWTTNLTTIIAFYFELTSFTTMFDDHLIV